MLLRFRSGASSVPDFLSICLRAVQHQAHRKPMVRGFRQPIRRARRCAIKDRAAIHCRPSKFRSRQPLARDSQIGNADPLYGHWRARRAAPRSRESCFRVLLDLTRRPTGVVSCLPPQNHSSSVCEPEWRDWRGGCIPASGRPRPRRAAPWLRANRNGEVIPLALARP